MSEMLTMRKTDLERAIEEAVTPLASRIRKLESILNKALPLCLENEELWNEAAAALRATPSEVK